MWAELPLAFCVGGPAGAGYFPTNGGEKVVLNTFTQRP